MSANPRDAAIKDAPRRAAMARRSPAWCATHDDAVPRLGNCCSMGGYFGEWDDCVVIARFSVVGA